MMCLYSNIDKPQANGERGLVLVFFIFVLVILLALAGLAIDAGNLYYSQLQLQKAVDGAALAGIGHSILERNQASTALITKTLIETRARLVLLENIKLSQLSLSSTAANPHIEFDEESATLKVRAAAAVDYLLMDAVPFFILGLRQTAASGSVAAFASVRRATANVALILDVSDSMECPGSGSCDCKTPMRSGSCAEEAAANGANQRIYDLQQAVTAFVGEFDQNRDRISLIPFNVVAAVREPLRDKKAPHNNRGFVAANFNNALLGLAAASNTNHCDGFFRAYQDALRAHIVNNQDPNDDEEMTYLFFTDGAPTAARLLLTSPTALPVNTSDLGVYDYLHLTVSLSGKDSSNVIRRLDIPSPLIPMSDKITLGTKSSALVPNANAPLCSAYDGASGNPFVPSNKPLPDNAEGYSSVLDNCLADFGFHMPHRLRPKYGSNYGPGKSKSFGDFAEQYYNCAVQASDFVREHRGTVYVVGLGPAAASANLSNPPDPYQDTGDALSRKDNLLIRLARDADMRAGQEGQFPDYNFGEIDPLNPADSATNSKWHDFGASRIAPRYGRYAHATDSAQLTEFFLYIAARIKLQLVK